MKFLSFPVPVQETVEVTRLVRDPDYPRTFLNALFPFLMPKISKKVMEFPGRTQLSEFQVTGWPHPMGQRCDVIINEKASIVGMMAISKSEVPADDEDGPVFTCVCDYVHIM